jgi:dipeptidyl aminopeptidase/acylaminoacyl peptidase
MDPRWDQLRRKSVTPIQELITRIPRLYLLATAALAAVGLLLIAQAGADSSVGPRLSFSLWKLKGPSEVRLETVGPNGSDRRTLVGGGAVAPATFDGGSWFSDGSALAFAGVPRGHGAKAKYRIYLVASDDGDLRAIPHTVGAQEPLISPDGITLAFSRTKLKQSKIDLKPPIHIGGGYFSTSTWTLNLDSGKVRRLTPWRNHLTVSPTSFSPDGGTLVLDRDKGNGRGPEVVLHRLANGRETVFARRAQEATFSPDGTRVALISYRDKLSRDTGDGSEAVGELYSVSSDGSDWRRLTRTADRQEAAPSWDPSGQRLAFTRDAGPEWINLGTTNSILAINANGTCPTAVLPTSRGALRRGPGLYAPTWQPGPGCDTAPIAC